MSTPAPKCRTVKSSTTEPMPQLASSHDFAPLKPLLIATPLPTNALVWLSHYPVRPCPSRFPHLQSP